MILQQHEPQQTDYYSFGLPQFQKTQWGDDSWETERGGVVLPTQLGMRFVFEDLVASKDVLRIC